MKTNPVRSWLVEYLRHNPGAKPADAWGYLIETALPLGVLDGIAYDPQADVLRYQPGDTLAQRAMGYDAFALAVQRVRRASKQKHLTAASPIMP
jgi:hypothetical protein